MKTLQEKLDHLNKLSSKLSKKYEKLEEKYEKLRKKSEFLNEQAMLIDSAYQLLNSDEERTDKMALRRNNTLNLSETVIEEKGDSQTIKKVKLPKNPPKRGRPPGVKNKKNKRKRATADISESVPKPIGRPPGAKNKKKRRLGRPIGSKNKKTLLQEENSED